MSRLIMPSILGSFGYKAGTQFLAAISGAGGRLYHYNSITWTDVSPAGDANYTGASISDDGTKWLVCKYGGRVWLWNGKTYVEQTPAGSVDKNWYVCEISGNGKRMLVADYSGRAYYFDETSWNEIRPFGDINKSWTAAALNFDGTKFICAAMNNGRVWYWDGSSFIDQQIIGNVNANWSGVNISNDGTKLLATGGANHVYYFNGSTWNKLTSTSVNYFNPVASKDFSRIIVGSIFQSSYGSLFEYTGSTWAEIPPINGDNKQCNAALDGDGNMLIVGVNGARLYIKNGGGSWVEHQPAGNAAKTWRVVAVNKGV